jgi:hypothetical protein
MYRLFPLVQTMYCIKIFCLIHSCAPSYSNKFVLYGDLKTSITVRNNQKDLMLCCVTCVQYDISCDNLLTIILREPFFGRSWSFFAILIYKTWGKAGDSNSTESLIKWVSFWCILLVCAFF